VILLLSALLTFHSFDTGLPRSGQWRHGFTVADMNHDSRPDLAFSSPRKQAGPPVIYLNEGAGRWREWEEATFPSLPFDYGAVAAADFDGNGTNDLAVGSHYRGVTVILGDGKGKFIAGGTGMEFPTSPRESAPFSSRAVIAVDWNGDGRMDVAALSDGPRPLVPGVQLGVTIYENLVTWNPKRATGADKIFGDSIAAGDVDGDGLADLVTSSSVNGDARILRLGADTDLERRALETLATPSLVRSVDLHDFDNDGRDEIVVAYTASGAARTGTIDLVAYPNGSRPTRRIWSEDGVEVAGVAVGDVNGDGAADVVAGLQDGRLLAFRGDGNGFVTADAVIAAPTWRRGCAVSAVRIADLDGDGRDEVIATFESDVSSSASSGGIEVWRTSTGTSPRRRAIRH